MKKMMIILLTVMTLTVLVGCKEDDVEVTFPEVTSALDTMFSIEDNTFTVSEEVLLPSVLEGAIITWESSDPSVINENGTIVQDETEEKQITLSVSIKKGGNTQMVDYQVTIEPATQAVVNPGDYRIVEDKRVQDGALVISGGASSSNLSKIDDQFLGLGGGNDNIHILIIPTSTSGGASSSAVSGMISSYKAKYGLTDDQFSVSNITSTSTHLADDPEEVAKVENATAIWFTGGDQYLVTNALWKTDGTPTAVLAKIFEKWDEGSIVIGGSSAGAAIMSRVMIGGGLSVGALSYEHVDSRNTYNGDKYTYGALLVNSTGFGFFDHGVVDQHFDARDRLGRLIEATYVEGNKGIGFGVAENSSMIYNNTTKVIEVIGELFIVDTREATRTKTATNLSRYENIKISLLRGASTYNIETEEFTFLREDGKPMTDVTNDPGNQYETPTNVSQFTGEYESLYEFISNKLLDNRKDYLNIGRDNLPFVSSFTIAEHDYYQELYATNDRIIFEKRFFFDSNQTKAFYDPTYKEYSFSNVVLDIIPLQDTLTEQE